MKLYGIHALKRIVKRCTECGIRFNYVGNTCQRVKMRMCCEPCGYPYSEALVDTDPAVPCTNNLCEACRNGDGEA